MKKTPEEIAAQIAGLEKMKLNIPPRSLFGDDNHGRIDAIIAVLKGEKNPDSFYIDETTDEYNDGDNDIYFDAEKAVDWRNGRVAGNLFDEDLVK